MNENKTPEQIKADQEFVEKILSLNLGTTKKSAHSKHPVSLPKPISDHDLEITVMHGPPPPHILNKFNKLAKLGHIIHKHDPNVIAVTATENRKTKKLEHFGVIREPSPNEKHSNN